LKRPELELLEFSKHEISIALDVICPDDLKTSFSDVGGMETEIDIIMDNVILPFKFWKEEHSRHSQQEQQADGEKKLQSQAAGQMTKNSAEGVSRVEKTARVATAIECHVPGGMLMYGKPGTGKVILLYIYIYM